MLLKSKHLLYFFLIFFIIVFLRVWLLEKIPMLSGDEAWYGLRSLKFYKSLIENFTLSSGRPYTGPLITYFRVIFFYLFGLNEFSLRFPVSFLNILALLFLFLFLKRNFDIETAIIGLSIAGFSSWHIIFSRVADEVHTTLLFFLMFSLYLFSMQRTFSILFSFFILGLGVFTHIIFLSISVPMGILYFYIIFLKRKNEFIRIFFGGTLCFIIGFLPRFIYIAKRILHSVVYSNPGLGFVRIFEYLKAQFNLIESGMLYRLFYGKDFTMLPIMSLIGVLTFIFFNYSDKKRINFIIISTILWLLSIVFISGNTKWPYALYFIIPSGILTFIFILFLTGVKYKKLKISLTIIFCLFNLYNLKKFYFSAHFMPVKVSYFKLSNLNGGWQSNITASNVRKIFHLLSSSNIKKVTSTDYFIFTPLRYLSRCRSSGIQVFTRKLNDTDAMVQVEYTGKLLKFKKIKTGNFYIYYKSDNQYIKKLKKLALFFNKNN